MTSVPLWTFLAALSVIGFLLALWMRRIEKHASEISKTMKEFVKFVGRTEVLLEEHGRRLDMHDDNFYDLREKI